MCKYTKNPSMPDNSTCPDCGYTPLLIFHIHHDDENGVTDYMAHCEECDSDWQWIEYYTGCETTGRTIIDRAPIARKWWG